MASTTDAQSQVSESQGTDNAAIPENGVVVSLEEIKCSVVCILNPFFTREKWWKVEKFDAD